MKKKELRTTSHCLGFGTLVSALLLLAAGVTSCAKEEDSNQLPDGKYPMTFTAQVEGLTAEKAATRATTDNSWAGTEEVAVQVGSNVKKYTAAAATGVLSAASDVTPFYWQTTADIEVSAWHSHNYSSVRPTSFTVQTDQSSTGYQQSDLLYAAAQQVTFETPAALTFKHLPAKVVVNLKAGDGVMDNDVQSATVSIVNQALTSGAIDTHWTVAQATAGNSVITPNVLPTPTTDYQKSLQAIVVPQQMQSKKFIRVTAGGNDYFYTPATDANLEAGKQYTYNITVQKNGITVTASDATVWGGETSDIKGKEIKQGFAAFDLKMGDYYYSDGTWSDGGYREYVDGTTATLPIKPVLTDASGNPRTILGIVMKVGRDLAGAWKDDCDYKLKDGTTEMSTIHGYVLALHDANVCTWGSYGTAVGTQAAAARGFDGYTNTNKIKAFAQTGNMTLQTAFPATYYATEDYEATHPSPDNTSGWFFPSIGQCQYWFNNKTILLASVQKVTGTAKSNRVDWYWYWSSSEFDRMQAINAWYVGFSNDYVSYDSKRNLRYVRSVLAF